MDSNANEKKTINIDPQLHQSLALMAVASGTTVGHYAENILKAHIASKFNPVLYRPLRKARKTKKI